MTLPLRNRIKKQKDFEEVFAKGKTVKGSFFLCKGLYRPRQPFRFAAVVPAKVSSAAVTRNRLKRRMVRVVQDLLSPLPSEFDIVTVVQRPFKGSDEELRTEVSRVLRAFGILPL